MIGNKAGIISCCLAAMFLSANSFAGITVSDNKSICYPEGMTVHSVHPENHGTRLLTMEEAVLSTPVSPNRFRGHWFGITTLAQYDGSKVSLFDVEKGIDVDSDPIFGEFTGKAGAVLLEALPETAENIVPNPAADSYLKVPEKARGIGTDPALAFTDGKSLYYMDRAKNIYTIAESESPEITYGQTVSRNEFGISGGIFWSPDGSKLAFYRKDESNVTGFPLLDITTRTGTLKSIKYPMNGMSSENVRLGIYSLAEKSVVYVAADDFGPDRYLTNITWSPDGKHIFIQVLDRTQKHMRLNMYRASDGRFEKTILTEDNEKFIEPLDPLHWLGFTGKFIYRTDNRDGYKNLYLCDTLGNISRITPVNADVKFAGEDGNRVFYTSAEVSPVENHLFYVDVSVSRKGSVKTGSPVRLTREEGWHNISLNEDCTWFIDTYSSFNVPGITQVIPVGKGQGKVILSSDNPLKDFKTGEMTLGTVRSADGKYDNWYRLYMPADFDPAKKYPVILYVYGGPHSQLVNDSWLGQVRMWEIYMAQRGYIVYVQDNRGTENRGAEYEKAIHKYCGQAEMADQMVGIHALMTMPYVDKGRIGVHGWSYGGFMTISLMTNFPEIFRAGVAGGPVIDWKWYEIMYGERYMETMETNPDGFAATSLIGKAKNLKGKLLICQGAMDNTVVWEHSLSFVQECIKNQIQLDYFPYPLAEHNVFGRDRIHLMNKVSEYLEEHLQ